MYTQERGNLVAPRTMGAQCYFNVVRQLNHGVAEGQDTDEHMEDMESEVDAGASDPAVEEPVDSQIGGSYDEINVALRRGRFRDAAELQQVVLYVLDNINAGLLEIFQARAHSVPVLSRRFASDWKAWHHVANCWYRRWR